MQGGSRAKQFCYLSAASKLVHPLELKNPICKISSALTSRIEVDMTLDNKLQDRLNSV
jgi:hypothetical protein